jgi:hypothetical protein
VNSLEKVSKYRSGPPRFGTRGYRDRWDNSVKTTKLTPEEMEQYKAGKSIEEILKGRERVEVAKKTLPITVKKYVEMHLEGLRDGEIASKLGMEGQQLAKWKWRNKSEVEEALKNFEIEPDKVNSIKTIQENKKPQNEPKIDESETVKIKQEVKYINIDYKPLYDELAKTYEKLVFEAEKAEDRVEELEKEVTAQKEELDKRAKEIIDAQKQVTEWKERFEQTLLAKDQAISENINTENLLQLAREEIIRLKEDIDSLNNELAQEYKELQLLKQLVYLQMSREVNSA